MNFESENDDNPIKMEKTDFEDSELTTSLQESTIDEQCFRSSALDFNSRKIKVEADDDGSEREGDFTSKCGFNGLKTESYEDEEDGSTKKAISMSNVITIPNILNPAKVLKRESSSTRTNDTRIDGNERVLPSLQQGRQENSYKPIRKHKRLHEDTDGVRCSNENKVAKGTIRNPAGSKRIHYKETDSSDDNYIFCEECQVFGHRDCPIHGPIVPREDACSGKKPCNVVMTLPPNLSIKESSLPEAGLGVFALQEIPIGTQFGPNKRRKIVKAATDESTDTRYMWEIMKDGKISRHVDGKMDSDSNWMRYINCARTEAEQNLVALQHENEIYCQAHKTIKIDDELLVWYGDEYASGLGKVFDDLDSKDTSCKEPTLSKETVGNRQHCSTKKLKRDLTSDIIGDYPDCRNVYSGRLISNESHERLEYVCVSCSSIKESNANSTCVSEVTHNMEATDVASQLSQLAVATMTENSNTARSINASNQTRQKCVKCNGSTMEIMVSQSFSGDILTQKETKYRIDNQTSSHNIEPDSNDLHQNLNTGKMQCSKEICQSSVNPLSSFKKHMQTPSIEKIHKCNMCQYASSFLGNFMSHMRTYSGEKPYKCKICQCAFHQSENLKTHMRTHSGEKPYKCEICQRAFKQPGSLKMHKRTHSGEKPYKCEICQRAFNQLGSLKMHMRTHSGEKPYKCEICQRAFNQSGHLKKHMGTHSGEKPYKCEICQRAFHQSGTLKTHMRTHSGEKSYKCEICQRAFKQPGSLKMHIGTHSGEKPYKCEICQRAFHQSGTLKTHMRTHSGEKPYKCEICQRAFKQPGSLKMHMRTHSGEKPYKCEICQRAFNQSRNLKMHKRTHSGEKSYKCEICQCGYNQLGSLKNHMRTHSGEKPYKCEICQRAFHQSGNLKTHMRTHSGEKPYKCEICQRAFNQSGSLKVHKRTHSGEKPYKCEICQRAFNQSGSLKMHKRTHSGEKPYKCEICQRVFNHLVSLRNHMRIHSGEKPYKCEICQRAFYKSGHLKNHLRIHSGEKPFKCKICQRAFNQSGSLNKHMRTHSGEKPYKCKICQCAFKQSGSLKNHMRTHSGEKPFKCEKYHCAFSQSGT